MRGYFLGEVQSFVDASQTGGEHFIERLRRAVATLSDAMREPDSRASVLDIVQTPGQRAVLDRLTALMTLLEGHAEFVMDGVGPEVIPTVEQIRARFNRRREAGNPLEKAMRKLLGIDVKMRQYAEGRKFVHGVVERVGMAGFNKIFSSPLTLPAPRGAWRPGRLGGAGPRPRRRLRTGAGAGLRKWSVPRHRSPRPASRSAASLHGIHKDALVLVACSGGADSLALAAATAFVAPRMGLRAGLVTIDHGLQDGSDRRAAAVAAWGESVDLRPSIVVPVDVSGRPGGPEAAAREARYDALLDTARAHDATPCCSATPATTRPRPCCSRWPAAPARAAGGDAGPARRRRAWRCCGPCSTCPATRPARRAPRWGSSRGRTRTTLDPSYARSRVRGSALPALVDALGPGVVSNLARTARLLAQDAEALDVLAAERAGTVRMIDEGLSVAVLEALLPALARPGPALLGAVAGLLAGRLSHRHVTPSTRWSPPGTVRAPVHLPGGIQAGRVAGVLRALPD